MDPKFLCVSVSVEVKEVQFQKWDKEKVAVRFKILSSKPLSARPVLEREVGGLLG